MGAENSRSQLRSGSALVEATLPSQAACTRSDQGQYLARVPAGGGPQSSSPASGLYLSPPHSCGTAGAAGIVLVGSGWLGRRTGRQLQTRGLGWSSGCRELSSWQTLSWPVSVTVCVRVCACIRVGGSAGSAPAAPWLRAAATKRGRRQQAQTAPAPQSERAASKDAGQGSGGSTGMRHARHRGLHGLRESVGKPAGCAKHGTAPVRPLRWALPCAWGKGHLVAVQPLPPTQPTRPLQHLEQVPGHVKGAVAAAHIVGDHAAQLRGGRAMAGSA